MLLAILSICSKEELVGDNWSDDEGGDDTRTIADIPLTPSEISQRRAQIKSKILAVGRMQRVFQLLRYVVLLSRTNFAIAQLLVYREEAENATELTAGLDTESPGVGMRLGPDALGVQGNQVRRNIHSFDDA
jgi:serine/threonine-protein phosphatase 2B catalytic subunit